MWCRTTPTSASSSGEIATATAGTQHTQQLLGDGRVGSAALTGPGCGLANYIPQVINVKNLPV